MSDPLFFIDKNPEDEENIGMKKERRKKITWSSCSRRKYLSFSQFKVYF